MSKNKTRTKDKYRVVYNDTQRIELENEFRLNEYIAIPRKQEIAQKLQLSERQIKIWFQNRRAKKRKQQKRRQTSSNNSNNVINNISTSPYSGYISGNSTCTKDTTPPATSLINIKSEQSILSPTSHLQDQSHQDHQPSFIAASQEHQQQHSQYHHHQVQQQAVGHIMQVTDSNDNNNATNPANTGNYYQDAAVAAVAANQDCHQEYYDLIHHHHHHQQHQQNHQQQQHTRSSEPFTTLQQHSHHHHNHLHHPSFIQHHTQQSSNAVAASTIASQCWPNINQSTPPHVATSPAVMNQFHLESHHTHQIAQSGPPALQAPVSPYADHATASSDYTNGYQTQHQHYVPNQHTCNVVYCNTQHHFKA